MTADRPIREENLLLEEMIKQIPSGVELVTAHGLLFSAIA